VRQHRTEGGEAAVGPPPIETPGGEIADQQRLAVARQAGEDRARLPHDLQRISRRGRRVGGCGRGHRQQSGGDQSGERTHRNPPLAAKR